MSVPNPKQKKDYSVAVLSGKGDTDYARYMQTDTLLALQRAPEEVLHRDETLFQIVHQSTELWLKLCCHETGEARKRVADNQILGAVNLLSRAAYAIELVTQQLEMLRYMTPWDFQQVRPALGNGSGFESPGWRGVQHEGEQLAEVFDHYLETHDIELMRLYKEQRDTPVFNLAEALIEWDERVALWRTRHYKVAVRTIGHNTVGTKGTPVDKLTRLLNQKFFPKLWTVRSELTRSMPDY